MNTDDIKRSASLCAIGGSGAIGGLGKGVARNLLEPQQDLSTRFVSLRSRGIQNFCRTSAIVKVIPPCNVVLWAFATNFSASKVESEINTGYSPTIRPFHTRMSSELLTKFNWAWSSANLVSLIPSFCALLIQKTS